MQHQEESEWCWAATSVSIADYYQHSSPWVQCSLVNRALGLTTCCKDGSDGGCNVPWYLDRALAIVGHLAKVTGGKPSFSVITEQIGLRRPLGVRIGWFGGGGHFPAVTGYDPRGQVLTIDDPLFGRTWAVPYDAFPAKYQTGGTWTTSYETQ
jgi:hypothetical protein